MLALSFLGPFYLTIKALHILSVIAWMAGLLMLPRLLVYHAQHKEASNIHNLMSLAERRLIAIILWPAFGGTLLTGGLLLLTPDVINWSKKAVYIKLTFAFALIILQHLFVRWSKNLQQQKDTRPHKFYRVMNEVPYLLAVVIVFMAVLKPF